MSQNQLPKFAPDNAEVLVGLREIATYLRKKSIQTVLRWHKDWGFPMTRGPGGAYITTKSAIDRWILASGQADLEARSHQEKGS